MKVGRVHRQSLVRASNSFTSIPTNSLEIITHTPPIRFRLQEVLLQEYAQICRRPPGDPLRNLVTELIVHQSCTPIHMLQLSLRELPYSVYIANIEPCYLYSLGKLKCDISNIHNTYLFLGSSKNRTPNRFNRHVIT